MFEAALSPGLTILLALFLGTVLGWLAVKTAQRYSLRLVAEQAPPEDPVQHEKLTQTPDKSDAAQGVWRWQYRMGTLLGAALFTLLTLRFGLSAELALAAGLTLALMTLALIDQRHLLLPDSMTLPLAWLGLLCNIPAYFTSLQDAVIGAVLGYSTLWTIYWLFKLIRGKEGLGHGDFKLTAALGAWLGWQALPGIIFTAALVGACVGLAQVIGKKRQSDQPMPFGPFLAAAGFVALCTGSHGPWLLSI